MSARSAAVAGGVTRVSLGAQSFNAHVLETLERRASPDTVREAVAKLRAAGVDEIVTRPDMGRARADAQ